MQAEHQVIKVK